jgi:hypothetical protein
MPGRLRRGGVVAGRTSASVARLDGTGRDRQPLHYCRGMAQLPRVAVLGGATAGAAVLDAIVDSGLRARWFTAGPPSALVAAYLAERGLADHVQPADDRPAVGHGVDGTRPFIVTAGQRSSRWDALIVADEDQWADIAPALGLAEAPRLFRGVFALDTVGVYAAGPWTALGLAAADLDLESVRRIAHAQGRCIGDYLRGRYVLPPTEQPAGTRRGLRQRVAAGGAIRVHGTRLHRPRVRGAATAAGDRAKEVSQLYLDDYLDDLRAEQRRGHRRAAAADYPIPVPGLAAGDPLPSFTRR